MKELLPYKWNPDLTPTHYCTPLYCQLSCHCYVRVCFRGGWFYRSLAHTEKLTVELDIMIAAATEERVNIRGYTVAETEAELLPVCNLGGGNLRELLLFGATK